MTVESRTWFEDEPLPPPNPVIRRILIKLHLESIQRFLKAMETPQV